MAIIRNLDRIKNMTQQEKDVLGLESLDNLIQVLIDYTNKKVIPRLPEGSIGNLKAALDLKYIAKDT